MYTFNKWYWENRILTYKIIKMNLYFTPYTKINSKWVKDRNVRTKNVKLLEEKKKKTEKKLPDAGFGSDFLDVEPRA